MIDYISAQDKYDDIYAVEEVEVGSEGDTRVSIYKEDRVQDNDNWWHDLERLFNRD